MRFLWAQLSSRQSSSVISTVVTEVLPGKGDLTIIFTTIMVQSLTDAHINAAKASANSKTFASTF